VTTLHVLIDSDDGPVELAQTITSDEHRNRTGRWRRSDAERAELALDTATVLAALPEDLRDLAMGLMDASPSQVARDLGVPRSTLQRRLERLRRHFEDAGLRDYR
jgi:DNA-directed RNA polymerase specialized sigma24 family protein